VEGYVESIATGLIAGINACRIVQGKSPVTPPRATACGSLLHYIAFSDPDNFQPINMNLGILAEGLPAASQEIKERKERHRKKVEYALQQMERWLASLQA